MVIKSNSTAIVLIIVGLGAAQIAAQSSELVARVEEKERALKSAKTLDETMAAVHALQTFATSAQMQSTLEIDLRLSRQFERIESRLAFVINGRKIEHSRMVAHALLALPDQGVARNRLLEWLRDVEARKKHAQRPHFAERRRSASTARLAGATLYPPQWGYGRGSRDDFLARAFRRRLQDYRRAKDAYEDFQKTCGACRREVQPLMNCLAVLLGTGDPKLCKAARVSASELFCEFPWLRSQIMKSLLRSPTRDAIQFFVTRLAAEDHKKVLGPYDAMASHGLLKLEGPTMRLLFARFRTLPRVLDERIAERSWPAETRSRFEDIVTQAQLSPLPKVKFLRPHSIKRDGKEMRPSTSDLESGTKARREHPIAIDPRMGSNYAGPAYATWLKKNLAKLPVAIPVGSAR